MLCQSVCAFDTYTHVRRLKHMHLAALYPCTYWAVDKDSGKIAKKRKKPSNLGPMLVCLANDLLHWYDGKMVTDYSRSEDDPGRVFLLRAVLLFWCGDYPGLGEASNFTHAGYFPCHWCKIPGEHSKGLQRMVYGRYRRYRARKYVDITITIYHQFRILICFVMIIYLVKVYVIYQIICQSLCALSNNLSKCMFFVK